MFVFFVCLFFVPVDFDAFCCFCFVFVILVVVTVVIVVVFVDVFVFVLVVFVLLVVGKCRWAPVLLRAARCCLEL
jgi:hypothetical protein